MTQSDERLSTAGHRTCRRPVESSNDELKGPDHSGRVLSDRYALGGLIGTGGTSTVYAAFDSNLRRSVAVKVIHPEHARTENQRRRILQEAALGAQIAHRNLMPVYDIGEEVLTGGEHLLFVVMPLLRGSSLRSLILDGSLHWTRAVRLARQLLAGLEGLHGAGVLHRDVKPENCLVSRQGSRDLLRVLDLGLAKAVAQHPTITAPVSLSGAIMGTVSYVSPEQARGLPLDERADLYSAGVVLFELLTLQRPFEGTHYEVLHAHVERPAPRVRDLAGTRLPESLEMVVLRSMAKQPAQRYTSAAAFSYALLSVLEEAGLMDEEDDLPAKLPSATLEGCEAAKASLAAWTSFEYGAALDEATRAARLDSAWSPLRLLMSCLPEDPL